MVDKDKQTFMATNKTDWAEVLKAWETSGQPQKIFCDERGLNYATFVYQRSQQREKQRQGGDFLQATLKSSPVAKESLFCIADVLVQLPSGVRIKFPLSADKTQLRTWLEALGVTS